MGEGTGQCQVEDGGGDPTMPKQRCKRIPDKSKWRWGRRPNNAKVKMGEETGKCQSKDGGGHQTMSKET